MRRREFITLLGVTSCGWALPTVAQQSPIPVIAILGSGPPDASSSRALLQLLDAGMRDLGLIQGRDYRLEQRWAGSDTGRFPALAAELLEYRPSAVVVSTVVSAKAVQTLSRTVPIVGTGLNDPIAAGLVASLSRPGGNITGVSTMAEDVLLKMVEIMREALPEVRRLTAMSNPTNPSNRAMLDTLKQHVANTGILLETLNVGSPADLDSAFVELERQKPGALFVLTDNSLVGMAETIIERALARKVPTFGNFSREFARSGALFTYARDNVEALRSVARLLKRILAGANPADLPIEQPTKFNLVLNLKTAQALGITVPPTLLARADEVIE